MGCTSSTPNVSEVHANSTDRTIHFEDDIESNIKGNDETINENHKMSEKENGIFTQNPVKEELQVDSNHCNLMNDLFNMEKQQENDDTEENIKKLSAQEKKLDLKEVVEHALSTNYLQKVEYSKSYISDVSLNRIDGNETETQVERIIETNVPVTAEDTSKDEDVQESASPSQSECSRATRWEALADMAAELPPSLTVDPITGQIYALSK